MSLPGFPPKAAGEIVAVPCAFHFGNLPGRGYQGLEPIG